MQSANQTPTNTPWLIPSLAGHRHPFYATYKVGFTKQGRVLAIDLDLYHNAGNSWDLSHSIMDRALGHSDCCYKIPNVRVKGHMCFTHQSSNTAFRGFGGPQVGVVLGVGFAVMATSTWDPCVRQGLCSIVPCVHGQC